MTERWRAGTLPGWVHSLAFGVPRDIETEMVTETGILLVAWVPIAMGVKRADSVLRAIGLLA